MELRVIREKYLWIVVGLVTLGLITAYCSSSIGYVTEVLKTLDGNGNMESLTILKQPLLSWILAAFSTLLLTLAISLFISVFVINKIERSFASEREAELKKIQESININVFDSLFKNLVPEEIFSVFKSDVISNKIVRKNADWLYDFRLLNTPGEIELTQTIKYELHNTGHSDEIDAISAKFDAHAAGSGITRAVCMFEGREVASFKTDDVKREPPDDIEECRSTDGNVLITRYPDGNSTLKITATIPAGKKIDVTLIYVTIYCNDYVNDGYFTKYPMINAKLTATYPQEFEFDIFQAMSSELQRTLNERNRSIYEVTGGILPHQGFVYSLRRKKAKNNPAQMSSTPRSRMKRGRNN